MTLGLVGRKVGMTRVFNEQGASVPVTVLDMSANRVTQVKSKDTDGYTAVQVTFGQKKANRVNKAQGGHFAKAGVEAGRGLVEFPLSEEKLAELKAGDEMPSEAEFVAALDKFQGKIKIPPLEATPEQLAKHPSHQEQQAKQRAQDGTPSAADGADASAASGARSYPPLESR